MTTGIAIALTDSYSLFYVWEFKGQTWRLLSITRLKQAIVLSNCSIEQRLVFPSHVNPNSVWGKLHSDKPDNLKTEARSKEIITDAKSNQEMLLNFIQAFPGSNTSSISKELKLNVSVVRQHLHLLEKQGKVRYCPSPLNKKSRLYYLNC